MKARWATNGPGDRSSPCRDIAVVIVNFRTPDLTARAADSVLSEPETAQVVIVDNASNDGSAAMLLERYADDPRVTVVISERNLGFGLGCNLGAGRCSEPFLMLLNSDAIVIRGALSALRDHWAACEANGRRVGCLAPRVLDELGRPQRDAMGRFPTWRVMLTRRIHEPCDPSEPDWVSGCAMFLDRKAFSAIGGFDAEIFMYLEDIVLCWNLRRLGYGILQCEDAQVQHLGGRSHRSTWRRKRQYRASQQVMLRHLGMGPVARAAFRAVSLPSALLSLLRNPVRCDRPG